MIKIKLKNELYKNIELKKRDQKKYTTRKHLSLIIHKS